MNVRVTFTKLYCIFKFNLFNKIKINYNDAIVIAIIVLYTYIAAILIH